MSITVPIIAADGAKATVALPDPVINASGGNTYPNAGIWTTGGTLTDSYAQFTDLPAAFEPAWKAAPVTAFTNPDGSGLTAITTPTGPGFQVVCTDANTTTWDNTCKAILCHGKTTGADAVGTVSQWTFNINLPKQTIPTTGSTQNGFFSGVVWELHTSATVQPCTLSVDLTNSSPNPNIPKWRAEVRNQVSWPQLTFFGPPIDWGNWHRFDVQTYWTLSKSGWMRWYYDGVLFGSYSGQTMWPGDSNPYLQYGWYAGKGGPGAVANTSKFGPVTRTQYAALGS